MSQFEVLNNLDPMAVNLANVAEVDLERAREAWPVCKLAGIYVGNTLEEGDLLRGIQDGLLTWGSISDVEAMGVFVERREAGFGGFGAEKRQAAATVSIGGLARVARAYAFVDSRTQSFRGVTNQELTESTVELTSAIVDEYIHVRRFAIPTLTMLEAQFEAAFNLRPYLSRKLAKEITERTEKVRIARAENASELAPLAQGF